MITVQVKNGNVDAALKRFKQKVAKSGLPSEVKKKKEYIKPGVEKRNAKKEAIKNSRKATKRDRSSSRSERSFRGNNRNTSSGKDAA